MAQTTRYCSMINATGHNESDLVRYFIERALRGIGISVQQLVHEDKNEREG